MRLALAFLTLTSIQLGTPASAQWQYTPYGDEIFGAPAGFAVMQGTALSVLCSDGAPLLVVNTDLSPAGWENRPAGLGVTVDGQRYDLPATYVPSEAMVYAKPDQSLLRALKMGSSVTVSSAEVGQWTTGLRGSSKAIDQALASCAAPSGAAASGAAPDLAALRAALTQELMPECRQLGGTEVVFENGAFRASGNDVTADFHYISCPGAVGISSLGVGYCGAAQCLQREFTMQNGRLVETRQYYQ